MFSQIFLLFCISCVLSPLILFGVARLLRRYKLLDRPHLYKSEHGREPAPYGAGIMLLFTLLLLSPFVFYISDFSPLLEKRFAIVLGIGILITLVSWIDDMDTIGKSRLRVPPIIRLLMQIGVGAIVGITSIKIAYVSDFFGGITSIDGLYMQFDFFDNIITIYLFPLLVTIFWYVLVFNSVNFSDGVPGMAGGFATITFIILAILAIKLYVTDRSLASQENSRFLLTILSMVIPASYVLTRADISRRVIMGDSGTIMLAFLIATLSIIAGGKIATALSVLGIYVIDFVYVIMSRILQGKNPMKGDQTTHLHFRLMELGLTQAQIRNIVYFLTFVFGLSAIFLSSIGKIILLTIVAGVSMFLTEILSVVRKK